MAVGSLDLSAGEKSRVTGDCHARIYGSRGLRCPRRPERGWCSYFSHGVSSRTFNYLDHFAWWRVVGWLRKRHHGLNWGTLSRRYLPGWEIRDGGTEMFRPRKVAVSRYRYRGTRIPTPLDEQGGRSTPTNGMNPWRAGCAETCKSGSEGGPRKRAGGNPDTAPRPDPYSKLKGPAKWTYFYLYVILDVFSRYVLGWTVQHREGAKLAKALISQACEQQQIPQGQLTMHADRGSSMTSKTVAFLLADLGVTRSHNRPYTSTDNPYSEAHFKTLKYRPQSPQRFENIQQARAFCRTFLDYHNHPPTATPGSA